MEDKFYADNWDGSKWLSFSPYNLQSFPELPGCYVVVLDGRAIYVGQSTNIRNRIRNHQFRMGYGNGHITKWGGFHGDLSLVVKVRMSDRCGDWAMREIRLIRRLQPEFNSVMKGVRS